MLPFFKAGDFLDVIIASFLIRYFLFGKRFTVKKVGWKYVDVRYMEPTDFALVLIGLLAQQWCSRFCLEKWLLPQIEGNHVFYGRYQEQSATIIKWRQRNMGSISNINPGMPFIAPWDIFEQIGGVLAEVYGALSPFLQLETMQSNGWKRIRETIHGVSLLFQGNFISGDHQPMGPLFVSPALHTKPKH